MNKIFKWTAVPALVLITLYFVMKNDADAPAQGKAPAVAENINQKTKAAKLDPVANRAYLAARTSPVADPTAGDTGSRPKGIDYGRTPQTPEKFLQTAVGKANLEAHRDPQQYPERLSVMSKGKPFDAARWENDQEYRNDYLTVNEPSRAYDTANDPKATRMIMASRPAVEVAHGQKVTLAVKATAGAPVSFFSPHLNRFNNGFTAITVVADADGIAKVEMVGVPGTIGPTPVICASPFCANAVTFKVTTLQSSEE